MVSNEAAEIGRIQAEQRFVGHSQVLELYSEYDGSFNRFSIKEYCNAVLLLWVCLGSLAAAWTVVQRKMRSDTI